RRRACARRRHGDRRRGPERQRVRRRPRLDVPCRKRHPPPNRQAATGGRTMKTADVVIAANTIWVVVAAVLVMFMQAGFALLEAGLARMKNAAHIAGKNVLVFGVCSLVYWAVGFGLAFGDGNALVGTPGFLPSSGALLLGPRIGKFGRDGRANPIPGHNMPYAVLGTIILWFGWFGFNPGSTLGVVTGDRIGYFGYVALTTNLAAAAGALGGVATAWVVLRKPDVSMMLNGALAALVAITAACGFVAPWAAIVIGLASGFLAVTGVLVVERLGIDDPIGAVAVHGASGVWGTIATGLFAVPALAANLGTGSGGFVYTGSLHQVWVQLVGLAAVGAFTFSVSFGALWTMKQLWGIRVEPHIETSGLDVSEHGMWGYPEFY